MMQLIRDKAQGIVSWVIVGIIALVFCSWGVSGFVSQGQSQVVAKVRGRTITANEVDTIYNRWLAYVSTQKGFNPALVNPKVIKEQITKSLADQFAVVGMLKYYGFGVSDQFLIEALRTNSDFQQDGKFSLDKYKDYLARINMDEAGFEEVRRNDLLVNQAQQVVVNSVFALTSEVDQLLAIKDQTRSFGYTIVPAAKYESAVKISDDEVAAYYEKNKEFFVLPEKISLEYLELSLDDLIGQKQISEQEARDYYNKNAQLFSVKDFNQARKTVEKILKREAAEHLFSSKGEELANLTFENPQSLAVASEKLHLPIKSTDYFGKDGGAGIASLQEVKNAAFGEAVLVQKHNSDLIRISDDSYVVVRLKDRKPQKQQDLAEVRLPIVKSLKMLGAQEQAKQASEQVLAELKQGKTPNGWKSFSGVGRDAKAVDTNLLSRIFAVARPNKGQAATTVSFKLPSGDYAVVALTKVTDKVTEKNADSNLHEMIAKQVAAADGNLQYLLLQASLVKQAKIEYNLD